MWPFVRCCCRLPLFLAALLVLIAAAVGCQAAAPSAVGCSSCSAAAAATAAADPGQDNSLKCRSALAGLELATCDCTIGTSQPTTVPARQDLFNQAQQGQLGSILEHSADANQ